MCSRARYGGPSLRAGSQLGQERASQRSLEPLDVAPPRPSAFADQPQMDALAGESEQNVRRLADLEVGGEQTARTPFSCQFPA
jgi:hypothetical protein